MVWVLIRSASKKRLIEALLTSTHNIYFEGEVTKIIDKHPPNFEPRHEKTCFSQMRKQRRRSADGNRVADQSLCVRYIDSTISLLFKPQYCTAWFVSDLVGNPEDSFSSDTAQFGPLDT